MRHLTALSLLGMSFLSACSSIPFLSQPTPSQTANVTSTDSREQNNSSPREMDANQSTSDSPLRISEAPKIRKKVLVLRFLNRTNWDATQLVDRAYRETQRAVRRANDTILVPEEDINGHESFTFDDLSYDLKTIFLRARQNAISGLVLGSIEDVTIGQSAEETGLFRSREYQATARVTVRLYDVATEREVASQTNEASANDRKMAFFSSQSEASEDASPAKSALEKALEPILERFVAQMRNFDWKGRIARIEFNRYFINAGEETGLTKGQLLKVSHEGFAVEDPTTGNLIGQAPGRMKGVLKVVEFLGRDGAIATLHSGGGMREQDVVEIYSPK